MALVEMMEKGYLKHIISQNVDGLHRKSGIPAEKLSEVHGNTYQFGSMQEVQSRLYERF